MAYKLEKPIKFYKNQLDTFVFDIYQEYILDRTSIDLDSLLFRMKYMLKHNKDLEMIPLIRKEFIDKSLKMRKIFGQIIHTFLTTVIGFEEPHSAVDIIDILVKDIKFDSIYMSFELVVISNSETYLEYLNNKMSEDVIKLYPDKFFRFYVDSYNDGIAKAYPELFKNNNMIGVGKDNDVFVHSFTFQTSEDCSLNCTYCISGDSKILLRDYTTKLANEIVEGDSVIGFEEFVNGNRRRTLMDAKVLRVFEHIVDGYYIVSHPNLENPLLITGDHPLLTDDGWKSVRNLKKENILYMYDGNDSYCELKDFKIQYITKRNTKVYNFETELGTYIANSILVHNCYQFNKSPMRMDFDIAKKFIDELLNDQYGYINRYNSPAIILEFIGGEPLLEIKLTRKIYEYFLDKAYETNHPWFKLHRLSICSNGLQYFDKDVQEFFKEYSCNTSFNISIDGNKELHDACRIQPNGEGSYDISMMALNHYNKWHTPERNSKMTLAPANMKYLFESVKSFIENGMMTINVNCVFEEGWTKETALLEYNELKKLADYVLENDLEHLYISIFNDRQEDVADKSSDGNFCGAGAASMLSLRPNGQFYPCIRYMPTSVGDDKDDLCMGHIDSGLIGRSSGSEIIAMMDRNTRRGQTNDICYNCPIGDDCASCSALGVTVFNNNNKKVTFICIQMIAEALANVYYWNALLIKKPEYDLVVRKNNVPDEWALLVIDKDELEFLKKLEAYAMIVKMENS